MQVKIKLLPHYQRKYGLPIYATSGSVGMDIRFMPEDGFPWRNLKPGKTKTFETGICVQIPEGYEIQIRPRSGLSLNTDVRISNSPGTIDQDFFKEIKVIMTNMINGFETEGIDIEAGRKIAQIVLCPIEKIEWVEEDFKDTKEHLGFGSTGSI